jgi:cellulose synthase (UDP-forming)
MSTPENRQVDLRPDRFSLGARFLYLLLGAFGLVLAAFVIIAPFDLQTQAAFGVFTLVLFLIANRFQTRLATLVIVMMSVLVSTRYLWWRTTETLGFIDPFDMMFGYGLYAAEVCAWIVLMIGYFQVAWPLDREPIPLPESTRDWPAVDVFITTYNESLDVVRPTVLAAMAMDYPADKFKVYLLDDGRRPEFARFAEQAGCGYIVRSNNDHAKAGNINHALTVTKGGLIAMFDCDHVPTRAFLQMTIGSFLADRKLGMLQTPHHFYSPDPFERNLGTYGRVPNEGQLFYGLIQPGNDFWNAAFFCGSCAVLSRAALEEIGGIAVETVTEDAHTSLRMHRAGWNTAYLRWPLAAGLATERLSLHIGQRMRWARGMIQIFRTDNPLLGRGLSFGQRICYLNAMMYFLFPVPRFVFLTAPVAYLVTSQNIIVASAFMVMAYAGPHLIHTLCAQSRLDGKFRYSFWGEIYDNVLLFHILGPTLLALMNPKAGKFNVTDKGGILEEEVYDTPIMRPLMILILFLLAAIGIGVYRLNFTELFPGDASVLFMNLFWCCYSALTVLIALAVGMERRQVRAAPRILVRQPVALYFDGRRSLMGRTEDLSLGGGMLRMDDVAEELAADTDVSVNFEEISGLSSVTARIVAVKGREVRVEFAPASLDEERTIVSAVFGRADAWLHWDDRPAGTIWMSFADLTKAIGPLFGMARRRRRPAVVRATVSPLAATPAAARPT